MATSSILATIELETEEESEMFIKALEISEQCEKCKKNKMCEMKGQVHNCPFFNE